MRTTKNPAQHRIRRSLVALLAGCALLATAPGAALAAPVGTDGTGTHSIAGKKKVKVDAKLDKSKVKVNEKVKLKGKLDVQAPLRASGTDGVTSLEPLVVQRLVAGVWVDLTSTSCRPNGSYQLKLSFQVQAEIKLRVYHPETTLYASATSSVFSLLVI
ncbi:hypothetical protein SAMN05216266_102315 [Amycolatopsis marina]|uniref:Secreted protein n=1 Tax=Amycolatopsis marina TaxID=490629 RepID=A0A1I0WYY2_9PSEU|nr:hypothetical protein [Amycolatopsis marina]SFA93617.1 hypothetical protein SAMN05216266_102315 [Amycolatopsis marina]